MPRNTLRVLQEMMRERVKIQEEYLARLKVERRDLKLLRAQTIRDRASSSNKLQLLLRYGGNDAPQETFAGHER